MSKKTPEEMAREMSNFVNTMSFSYREMPEFIKEMSRDHRSLQQSFTGLCAAWLKHMADLPDNQVDLRNEYSRTLSRKMIKELDEYDLNLPLI